MVAHSYQEPSPISFGNTIIQSRTGCQQGHVFSLLLFCLVVHGTLESLRSEVILGNLDDFTLSSDFTLSGTLKRWSMTFDASSITSSPTDCDSVCEV